MNYPKILQPSGTHRFSSSKGQSVEIPLTSPMFEPWKGEYQGDSYGGKPILEYQGQPLFPELVILRHFMDDGWNGVWVDTYRKRYLVSHDVESQLNEHHIDLLNSIYTANGNRSGCFDVFAWKDEQVLFAESKWAKTDKIRETQIKWLFAALSIGMRRDSFLVVEWDLVTNDSA